MTRSVRSICTAAAVCAFAFSSSASAQSVTPQMSDPRKCTAILEDMGNVGFRISDSQVVADAIITSLRKRLGFDSVQYEGVAASASAMKKLLNTPEGAAPQDAQLKWFKECSDNAGWRVRARFGTDKKGASKHWITMACRKKGADADPKKGGVVEDKRFTGKTFLEARDALVAALPSFCGQIPSVADIPLEPVPALKDPAAPPGIAPKKDPKPWTPPPRRD